jgi:hypothetical protein
VWLGDYVPHLPSVKQFLVATILLIAGIATGVVYGKSTWQQSAAAHAWVPYGESVRDGGRTSVIALDEKRNPQFAISFVSTEFKWRLSSARDIELNGNTVDLEDFVRQLNLSRARAVVCVGTASATGGPSSTSAEELARARAAYLVHTVRQVLPPQVEVYSLILGQFKGNEHDLAQERQRAVIIIEVLSLSEGINLGDAIRAAMSSNAGQYPLLDLTKYPLFELQNRNSGSRF